jgi:hypothetical protein
VEVSAGGGDAGMAEGGLDQVDGAAAIKGVRSVSVAEPVRRNGQFDAGAEGGLADDAQDGHGFQRGAMLARPEHGIVLAGFAAQFSQGGGDRSGHLNGTGLAALAEDGDLDAFAVGLHVAPVKPADLADPHPGGVQEPQ